MVVDVMLVFCYCMDMFCVVCLMECVLLFCCDVFYVVFGDFGCCCCC